MRILQFLPTFVYGDAIGNEVRAIDAALKAAGMETQIYAENIQKRLASTAKDAAAFQQDLRSDDTVLYHMAISCNTAQWLAMQPCRKVMRYHNITPTSFFLPYDDASTRATLMGRRQLLELAGAFDAALCDSHYNREELERWGYRNTHTVPLIIQFEDYQKTPSPRILEKYRDGKTNLIFVGRIAPNKRQEDVIAAYYAYRQINPRSRLILVGSHGKPDAYKEYLDQVVRKLGLQRDVVFPGHISFEELLGFYHVADGFLSMSEHEGFCVPLVESMVFNVPVFAYRSTAVTETLGDGGVLFSEKNYIKVAETIHAVLSSPELKAKILQSQRERLVYFQRDRVLPLMMDALIKSTQVERGYHE